MKNLPTFARHGLRALLLLALCTGALQLVWAARIALMIGIDPQSTSFQRSEMTRLLLHKQQVPWSQTWVDAGRISEHLKRAVIASEDACFAGHAGVDWEAIERAWARNQRNAPVQRADSGRAAGKLVGGSTITQQLAKNLFLSGERTVLRKAQEFVLTLMLEFMLPKQRILEIYLNSVEWGEGIFGAQAASRHYFGVDARRLSPEQAARLAVMLPAPKRFQRRPASDYVLKRAATIMARMDSVALP